MKTSPFYSRRWLALGLLLPLTTLAQPVLKETVVSASGNQQLLSDALPHTTVINRTQIERSQAPDLPSLLAGEAGLQLTQSGGRGSASNLFMRGSAASQLLLLVDGVPLTKQDSTGTISIEHLTLDQVERVEIVRGNVSAIYGSGAIGGVIQVFTRPGSARTQAGIYAEAGSFASRRLSAHASGAVGDTRWSLGVSQHQVKGFSAINTSQYPNENPDRDGYNNRSANFSLSHTLLTGHDLSLRLNATDARFDFDGGGFGSVSDIHKGRSQLDNTSLTSRNRLSADWVSELRWSQGRERSSVDARLTAFPYESQATTRTQVVFWNNQIALGPWLLNVGGEHQRQRIDSQDTSAPALAQARGVGALFVGLVGSRGAHSAQVNLRRDAPAGLDAKASAYLGYGYQLSTAWKLIASASSAFNLPPLGYLYDPFFGNPNLLPETARSTELGVQWTAPEQSLRATVFNTRVSNLLQFDPATFTFANISSASNRGLELSYSGKLGPLQTRASFTQQYPIDENTAQRLARRAKTLGSVGVSLPLAGWLLGADWRFSGARPDTPGNPVLGGYALLNLSARYTVNQHWSLNARIENLGDKHYQSAYGYNQATRSFYLGLRGTL